MFKKIHLPMRKTTRLLFIIPAFLAMALAVPDIASSASVAVENKQSNDFRQVAKEAIPAVVSIKVKGQRKQNFRFGFGDQDEDSEDNALGEDFLQRFFGLPRQRKQDQMPIIGQGSGFIVSPDGHVLTNSHVVKDMSEIIVVLNNGKEYPAKIIGQDPNTDVALIKIDANNLPYLRLGNSDDLEVGQWVVAIGNPLGLQASLTAGVVSAKGRNNLDLSRIEDYIQTDAAINRGNSGGPLLNLNSDVIGMNTAIISNLANGGYMGIGFAIPSNLLKAVMEDLKSDGSFKRGFIGVTLQPVDEDLAKAFGLEHAEGVLIAEVTKDSPADKAGLKRGDVIVKYNQQPVANSGSLRNAVSLMKPGSSLLLTVLRNNKLTDIKVEVGIFPTAQPIAAQIKDLKLGLEVENLNSENAAKLGYAADQGVVISNVDPMGPAAWAGLKKGALVLEVNKQKVANVDEFHDALQQTAADKPVLLLIKQGETTRFVSFKIG
jgi:serine protease Do